MENECAICLDGLLTRNELNEQLKVAAMTGCGHLYHEDCLISSFAHIKAPNDADEPRYPKPISYKEHPKCPKCRSPPHSCKDDKCNPVYGYYGDIAYRCYPFTRIFIEDDGRGLFKQDKDDEDVKYLEVKLSNNSVQKFDYARTARDLGLDLEAVLAAAEEAVNAFDPTGKRLPKKSRDKIETVQNKLEAIMTKMKDKQTDGVLKACIDDLGAVSQRLHDNLDLATPADSLRTKLADALWVKEEYAEERVTAAVAPMQDTITQLHKDQAALSLQLVDRRAMHEEAKSDLKKKEKQITELKQSGKKNKGLVSTLEKEKIKSVHEVKNIKEKMETAGRTVIKQTAELAELKSKLKDFEKRAKDREALIKKLQPKAAAGRKARDIIDLSSSMPPSTPPRKKVKLDRDSSPAAATESDLTEVAQSPNKTPKARTTRQGVASLSKEESADFSKLIAQSAQSGRQKREERDEQLKDSAMEKTWGWLAAASQANSSSTVVDTPPRQTRSTTKRKREELEGEAA